MKKMFAGLVVAFIASAALWGCGGGDDAITVGGALFTSAPDTVALDPGTETTYRINGGSPLYSASSGNANVVTARVDGGRLILTGVAVGATTVSVVDTQGSKVTINVRVGASGTAGGPLFTNAPPAVVLDAGSSATYSLNGGTAPYSAVSGDTNVVRTAVDTSKLTLTAASPGSTSVAITDIQGGKISIAVEVKARGIGTPVSLTPAALAVGNCTTRIPFLFSGGVPPYTVLTTDNFNVPVSSPLALGDGRFYFFADVHWPFPVSRDLFNSQQTLTVLDSGSRSAVATITTPIPTNACPANPLLTISPETANFRTSELLSFQIAGGPAIASAPTVTFADAGIAEVVSVTPATVTVRAVSTTRASTLMTVATSDSQRASVVLNVLPQP